MTRESYAVRLYEPELAEACDRFIRRTWPKEGDGPSPGGVAPPRVLFLKGQKQQAIELQDGAVKYASGRRKEQFQGTLDSYKSGQLPKPY